MPGASKYLLTSTREAGLLLLQLIELETHVKANPEWLTG